LPTELTIVVDDCFNLTEAACDYTAIPPQLYEFSSLILRAFRTGFVASGESVLRSSRAERRSIWVATGLLVSIFSKIELSIGQLAQENNLLVPLGVPLGSELVLRCSVITFTSMTLTLSEQCDSPTSFGNASALTMFEYQKAETIKAETPE
jgi:hypothetical protein